MVTQPLSTSLQGGFRFLHFPLPALYQPSLRSTCHCGQWVGLTVFRLSNMNGLGSVFLPVVEGPCNPIPKRINPPLALLAQACQHFWLVPHDGIYQQFTWVSLITQPSSLPHRACRFALSSRTRLTSFEDGLHCPARFIPPRCQGRMER